jgi:hypothetical protein
MGERIGRIGQIDADFSFERIVKNPRPPKKSVPICPIRPIRSPIVSQSYHPIPKSEIHNPKSFDLERKGSAKILFPKF